MYPLGQLVHVLSVPILYVPFGHISHEAYKVTVPFGVSVKFKTLAPLLYFTTPFGVVDHPANEYPFLTNPFVVKTLLVSYVCVDVAVLPPVFPFPSY